MDLALVQRNILTALINLHRENRQAIKSEEIAELMDRNPGTIRNQMQSLKALTLVGAVPGRHGGYRVTGEAYEALNQTMTRLIIEVMAKISVPRIRVKKIARRAIRISPKTSLQEAAKILINNGVQEALVEDKYHGLISMADINKAVAEGRTGLDVCEIMRRGFPTINSEEPIYEAIKMQGKMGASC